MKNNTGISSKKQASMLILKIRELNSRMAGDQYELCRCLATLHGSKLHLEFGYDKFADFCHDELPYSYGHALSFIRFMTHAKRLKYNKAETIDIIERIGISKAKNVLAKLDEKITVAKIASRFASTSVKFSFEITPTDEKLLNKKLLKYGLDVNENGRRMNATQTMLKLLKAA